MKKLFFTLVLCSFVGATFAQGVRVGVTAGMNLSSLNVKADEGMDVGYKAGFQAGIVLDYAITSNISIIPELNFSQKGAKVTITSEGVKGDWMMTLNYLTLPVNAAYKFELGMNQNFIIFAGPYVGYGLSTSNKVKAAGVEVDIKDFGVDLKFGSKDEEIKPLDFGLNAGLGYQFNSFFIKAQYNLGLANMDNSGYDSAKSKNSTIAFTLGYMF